MKYQLEYRIGALLYTPASNESIAEKICCNTYSELSSLALCLEDAVADISLIQAEEKLINTLNQIKSVRALHNIRIPLIFLRIRNPQHMKKIYSKILPYSDILTGFILPKFDMNNAYEYINIVTEINRISEKPVFIMPILESKSIAYKETRMESLIKIKDALEKIKQFVLNIRIGGNDFNNIFGLRRSSSQTIYDIVVIRDILSDIYNVFGRDYVVSGTVWEYFESDNSCFDYKTGLLRELELDRLNGFIGKTAIHPSQIEIINNSLKVTLQDFEDAKQILNLQSSEIAVVKTTSGERMNEIKVHTNWAKRIIRLADIYGIK